MRAILLLAVCSLTALAQTPSVTWIPIGPHHIPGPNNSIGSGKIQAIAIFPGDPHIMYAGGGTGTGIEGPNTQTGVFKTTDGGVTWTAMNGGLTSPTIDALYVDPANPNLVLAGTEPYGVYRSTDGGQTWTEVGTQVSTGPDPNPNQPTGPAPVQHLGPTADFAVVNGTIYAAVQNGTVQSTDGGQTWTSALSSMIAAKSLSAAGGALAVGFNSGNVGYAPPGSTKVASILSNTGGSVLSVAIDPATPSNIYVTIGPSNPYVLATSDAGGHWTKLVMPSGNPQAVAVNSSHRLYVGTNNSLYTSADGGQTLTAVPGAPWSVRRIYLPDDNTVVLGTDQGIHRTTDNGAHWSDLSGGITSSITTGFSAHQFLFAATDTTNAPVFSFDGGATWADPFYQPGNTHAVGQTGVAVLNPADPTRCYAYTQGGFYYSADRCLTFTLSSVLRGNVVPYPYGQSLIAVDPSTPSTVYVAARSDFYVSHDWGATFAPSGWGLTNPVAVAVSPAGGNNLFAGTTGGLYRSTDGGKSWSSVSLSGAGGYPTTIAVDPANPAVVLVGQSVSWGNNGGVYVSHDSGATFSAFNSGLSASVPNPCVNAGVDISVVRFNPDGWAALGSCWGVYLSKDGSGSWQDISANAVPRVFTDLEWDGGNLYAATLGNGVLLAQPFGPPAATLTLDTAALSFTAASGGSAPVPQSIGVSASAKGLPFGAYGAADSGGTWLSVSPLDGTTPGPVQVTVNPTGLAVGIYTGKVIIGSTYTGNGSIVVPVTLTVTGSTVSIGSVINAASYNPQIGPGTWVSIKGTNLARTTRIWTGDDFTGNNLPLKLDGVSVQIRGQAAPVYYVSPTQVNVLAPDGWMKANVPVTVNSPDGGSDPFLVADDQFSPAFFPIATKYIAAVHLDGTLVAPEGLFPGLPSSPAKPGETIELYGTGFGPTTPASPSATVNPPEPLQFSVIFHTGTNNGPVLQASFAGLISPGLVQFNLTIPAGTPDGDLAITAEVGAQFTQSGMVVSVHK
jgi:uncharacterized protein (TIGR03437 family)